MPPKTFRKQHTFKSNKDRLEYEDKTVNDPDQFENEEVQTKIFDILKSIGVHVHWGFTLHSLEATFEGIGVKSTEILHKVLFRKKADAYEDIQALIEQKKQEIIERM